MRSLLFNISIITAGIFAATETAFAGSIAVPGPIAAAGAPALLVIGGAFLAVRYLRARRKK